MQPRREIRKILIKSDFGGFSAWAKVSLWIWISRVRIPSATHDETAAIGFKTGGRLSFYDLLTHLQSGQRVG
jgi:hypothetical protein